MRVAGVSKWSWTWLIALWLWVAPTPAHADSGRPAGWDVASASGRMHVGRVQIEFDPTLRDEAAALRGLIPRAWARLERELKAGDLDDRLRVVLVSHSGRVADATGMPHWAAGVANPERGEILLARHAPDGSPTDLEELLQHELVHVALERAAGERHLPRWLHEGAAESFSDQISFGRTESLASAVFGPGVPDLKQLERAFRSPEPARVSMAYAAARDFVEFLRFRDPSEAKFRGFLGQLSEGYTIDAAFVRAYGRALPELSAEWRAGLPARFFWWPLLASGGLPFFLVGPLVAVGWIRRRRALARGWRRLEAEDAAWAQAWTQPWVSAGAAP